MFAPYKSHAHAYSNVHVETSVANADPHQLVLLLLDGALSAIALACRAIEQRDIPAKCRAVSRASGIIDEGLRGALDLKQGGALAVTLHDLYSCVLLRLTQAHAANDIAMLRECSDLLSPLRAAWTSIRPQLKAA